MCVYKWSINKTLQRFIPVLPEVGSIKVSPFLIRPCFSASSIIWRPIRSLMDPPGLKKSHLTQISQGKSFPICAECKFKNPLQSIPLRSERQNKKEEPCSIELTQYHG